jgi:hypothetical protein
MAVKMIDINPYKDNSEYTLAPDKRGQMPEWMSHILTGNINPFSDKFDNPVGLMAPLMASGMGLEPGWLAATAKKTPLASIWLDMMSERMPTYAESYPEKAQAQAHAQAQAQAQAQAEAEAIALQTQANRDKEASEDRWMLENPTRRRTINERLLPKDNWWGHKMSDYQQTRLENSLYKSGYDVDSVYDNTRGQSDQGPRDIAGFYKKYLGQDMRNLIN